MDKFSQQRGLLNKIHESISPGRATESFFNNQFKEVMDGLRLADDSIRSVIAGEVIGDGDPGQYEISMKQLMKSCRSNLNRREFMSSVSDLSEFHGKLREIKKIIAGINSNVDKVHNEFLFKDLDDTKKKNLLDLENRFAALEAEFVKEAKKTQDVNDILDFLKNWNKRGRGLKAYEERYKSKTENLKKETIKLMDKANKLTEDMISSLKKMASYRASRKIDNYVADAQKMTAKIDTFDKEFKKYYTDTVKPYVEIMKAFAEKKEEVKESKEEAKEEKSPETKRTPESVRDEYVPGNDATPPSSYQVPYSNKSEKSLLDKYDDEAPETSKRMQVPPAEFEEDYRSIAPPSSYDEPTPASSYSVVKVDSDADPHSATVFPKTPAVPSNISAHPSAIPAYKAPSLPPPYPVGPVGYFNQKPSPTLLGVGPQRNPTMRGVAPQGPGGHVPGPLPAPARMSPTEMKDLESQFGIVAHKHFYETLTAMSSESPIVVAGYINKYAKKIMVSDPETALELLSIAKKIKE